MRRDNPVIVLNSPSTPSSTGSTEDTFMHRVYEAEITGKNHTFYVNENEIIKYEDFTMDECDECCDENHENHSKDFGIAFL